MSTPARLFVISGPSGSGKSSLISDVLDSTDGFEKSISVTTRPRREVEQRGKQYHFTTSSRFEEMIEKGHFLEWAEYAGYYYGTPAGPVMKSLDRGINVILEIEVQGAMQVKKKVGDAYFIFILTTSLDELRQRLEDRGTDSREEIGKRLKIAAEELKSKTQYDCIIVNNNYNEALQNLKTVLLREAGKERKK